MTGRWRSLLAAVWVPVLVLGLAAALYTVDMPALALLGLGAAYALSWTLSRRHLLALQRWSQSPTGDVVGPIHGAWVLPFARLRRHFRRLQQRQEESDEELRRMRNALDLMPDALVVLDANDHLRWYNASAGRMHGLSDVGRPIDQFIRSPDVIAHLQSGDPSRPLTTALTGHPGRTFVLRLVAARDGSRLLIARDITEHAKLDAVRRDFVANVSHEIRTPLTVVSGFIETLIDLDLPREEAVRYLQTARHNAQTMHRLLTDLLTLSSLEHAQAVSPHEWFEMSEALQAWVADAVNLSAGRHRIELLQADAGQMLATRSEIETAARNLLVNAIRYTPTGGSIRVSWGWQAGDQEALLSVEDTGIGIAPEHLPRISERFYRVDRSRSRDTGGTGLGLAIVKHVAQRHDAQLQITSRLGKGSRFTLAFPGGRMRAPRSRRSRRGED